MFCSLDYMAVILFTCSIFPAIMTISILIWILSKYANFSAPSSGRSRKTSISHSCRLMHKNCILKSMGWAGQGEEFPSKSLLSGGLISLAFLIRELRLWQDEEFMLERKKNHNGMHPSFFCSETAIAIKATVANIFNGLRSHCYYCFQNWITLSIKQQLSIMIWSWNVSYRVML